MALRPTPRFMAPQPFQRISAPLPEIQEKALGGPKVDESLRTLLNDQPGQDPEIMDILRNISVPGPSIDPEMVKVLQGALVPKPKVDESLNTILQPPAIQVKDISPQERAFRGQLESDLSSPDASTRLEAKKKLMELEQPKTTVSGFNIDGITSGVRSGEMSDEDFDLLIESEKRGGFLRAPKPGEDGGFDTVFHETSPDDAARLGNSSMDRSGLNVTPNPDLALGQFGKGALIEFDAKKLKKEGRFIPIKKPGLLGGINSEFELQGGSTEPDNIKSITLKPGTKMSPVSKRVLQNRFDKKVLSDGSIRLTPKQEGNQ